MTSPLNFWSGKNYMKRDVSTGSTSIAAPVTDYGGGLGYYRTTFTINHTLGVIPLFRVYYEPFKDGVIYPAQGSRLSSISQGVPKIDGSANFGPICFGNPTATSLTIELGFGANTLTGSYPIYWVIYKDYKLA